MYLKVSNMQIHHTYNKKLKSCVHMPLPDWAILFTVEEREDDLQLLSQVGTHEALHLDKEMVTAGLHRSVLLPMSMFHLNDTHPTRKNTSAQTEENYGTMPWSAADCL